MLSSGGSRAESDRFAQLVGLLAAPFGAARGKRCVHALALRANRLRSTGCRLSATPVAAKIALRSAGGPAVAPISPTPQGGSPLLIKCTSTGSLGRTASARDSLNRLLDTTIEQNFEQCRADRDRAEQDWPVNFLGGSRKVHFYPHSPLHSSRRLCAPRFLRAADPKVPDCSERLRMPGKPANLHQRPSRALLRLIGPGQWHRRAGFTRVPSWRPTVD